MSPPGWDISSLNLAEAMKRAEVLEWPLQEQLWPHMEKMKPRPSIYIPEFIAANQEERADNVLRGSMAEQVGTGEGTKGHGRGQRDTEGGDTEVDASSPSLVPPRWSRSAGTSETSRRAAGWTKSSCCGRPTPRGSATSCPGSTTPPTTC